MTSIELITKIKTEIEKLIERYGSVKAKGVLQEGYKGGRLIGYEDALNVIRRIQEKLEKPMPAKVGKGLEVEAVNYIFDNGLNLSPRVATDFARHFYELGRTRTAEIYDELEYNRQRAEESVPKDLEEASSKFATHTAPNGVSIEFLEEKLSFQEGAKWQKEQIMKNAKDGWIDEECVIVLNDGTRVDLQPDYEKKPAFEFEYAQDVRVIVLPKED